MRLSVIICTAVLLAPLATGQTIQGRSGISLPAPPKVEAIPVTNDYFGTKIVDNYRWLEDAKSLQTRAFIDAQNIYTARYFKQNQVRAKALEQLDAMEHVTTWSIPAERADNYYFMKRLASEDQASIYIRRGWTGKDERLIDPAQIDRDPNTSISLADISRDGQFVAYRVRQGGADETKIRFFDLKTKKSLVDELPSGVYYSTDFTPDGKGVYYTRTNEKGSLVYLHVFGTRPSNDKLIFGREFHGEALGPLDLCSSYVTDDYRYLVIEIDRGVPAKRVDIVFRDLSKPESLFEVLVWGLDSRFSASEFKGSWYARTDYKSPNGRILKADPGIMPDAWTTIVPEGAEPLESFSIVGGKLYVNRLKDVQNETSIYTLAGKLLGKVNYDAIGSPSGIYGKTSDRYGYLSFDSLIQPPTLYRYDTVTGKRDVFAKQDIPFDTSQYVLKQAFFTSKDGTRVPMFIAGKKGLKHDGSERLLMTGYGGFDVSMTSHWNPEWAWWLQQGGWFAMPNMRGGGEYGERWHEQGMFEKKQNVFDDWFSAAQYLIGEHYTSPEHFAIVGRSNGGLLMGASMTQHPELFAAIDCGYPLLDMLRYQKFLQGPHWTTEYGSAENEAQFGYLLKYSPYHNVKADTKYPAILFFTGDSDTRVDPLHARKMTAIMQAVSAGNRPILLHYSLTGGHSAGVSVSQHVEDDADQLSFLWIETGHTEAE